MIFRIPRSVSRGVLAGLVLALACVAAATVDYVDDFDPANQEGSLGH